MLKVGEDLTFINYKVVKEVAVLEYTTCNIYLLTLVKVSITNQTAPHVL